MILYRRPPVPDRFDARTKTARDDIQAIIDRGVLPQSKDFTSVWSRLNGALKKSQHGKCGYCESRIDGHAWEEVEHYRPKSELTELAALSFPVPRRVALPKERGDATPVGDRGYWWLAYAWDNWLLACEHCNGHFKGTLFPVQNTPRATLAPGVERQEVPLLLNPFDDRNDPLDHLTFHGDGTVSPTGNSSRGAETIRTCGLHREKLVRDRAEVAALTIELLDEHRRAPTRADKVDAVRRLHARGRDAMPYAGTVRSLTAQWFRCSWRAIWRA